MTLVYILKNWEFPNLLRQLPDNLHEWDGVQFTLDAVTACDYLIVFNRVTDDIDITCPPEHIWCITQEPPVPEYEWLQQGFGAFHRIYTQYENLTGVRYVHSHGALPWWVGKSYTELKNLLVPEKIKKLTWITSNATSRPGHQQRMVFLQHIQQHIDFDLRGKGFQSIEDKWDGLAPYRYALAIENHSSRYYWTEKIMDCFLAWTMPIYYGCTHIEDSFPAESMIRIDIEKPDEAVEIIREAVASDIWLKNQDAIAYARELVLDKYQCFPFIVNEIRNFEAQNPAFPTQQVHIKHLPYLYGVKQKQKPSLARRVLSRAKRTLKRLLP